MFRKLIANLSFSPALITEISFYAQRLKRENTTRRLTVLFMVLALVIQSLAVFSTPESANASSDQDIIRGGVSSMSDFLARYDHNENDVKDIYTALGITRDEIAATHSGIISASNNTYTASRFGGLVPVSDQAILSYPKSTGGMDVRYFSKLSDISHDARFTGWIGSSTQVGWFGIIASSGSPATHGLPATIAATSEKLTKSISSRNITQNAPTNDIKAKPLDKISYTLKITNSTASTSTATFSLRIGDVLDYATLIDSGGGNYSDAEQSLSWPSIQLKPGTSQERTFVVQLNSDIAATATGTSSPSSYDCRLTLVFGNDLTSPVDCPAVKAIESIFTQLPLVGSGFNIAFGAIVLAVVAFFYLRTKQLKKEIRLIRHNFNTGII